MSGQLTYSDTPVIGFRGQLAEPFSNRQIDSGLVETAALGFGIAVVNGTASEQYVAAAVTEAPVGMTVLSNAVEQDANGVAQYAVEDTFPILRSGRLFMEAGVAIAKGDLVFQIVATGKLTDTYNAGTCTLVVGKALTASAADGDVIIVEFNFQYLP